MVHENKKRWYDKIPYTNHVLESLRRLSIKERYDIAREILPVVESIKAHNRELEIEETPLSLGLDRVLGLYQDCKRRWYDNSLPLARVFKTASCLPEEDFSNIMQGISMTLCTEEHEKQHKNEECI